MSLCHALALRMSSQRLFRVLAMLLCLVFAPHCDLDVACNPGEACECAGGAECYLGCTGDGCIERCENLERCGGVCEGDCAFECHDMNDCSASCGTDCSIDCHNTASCGALCGPGCNYRCQSVDRCGVEVGPDSTVNCNSVSSCEVQCTGDCHVTCTGTSSCTVSCPAGASPATCSDGSLACGNC